MEQAVASMYGIKTELIKFGFQGQIIEGLSDGHPNMHVVLRIQDKLGGMVISDPQKRLYVRKNQYWERYDSPQILSEKREVFTPDSETIY